MSNLPAGLKHDLSHERTLRLIGLISLSLVLLQSLLTVDARDENTPLHCYPVQWHSPCVFLWRNNPYGDGLVYFTLSGTRVFDALTNQTITSSDIPYDPSIVLDYQNRSSTVGWSYDGHYMSLITASEVRFYRYNKPKFYAAFPYVSRQGQAYAVWNPTSDTLVYYTPERIWLVTLDEQGEPAEPLHISLNSDESMQEVLWSLDGRTLLVLIRIDQTTYQVRRLDGETGAQQAVLVKTTSVTRPLIKWLNNEKLRLCCNVFALNDEHDLDNDPTTNFIPGRHYDINGTTWDVTEAPVTILPELHDSGRYEIWWSVDEYSQYNPIVIDFKSQIHDRFKYPFGGNRPPMDAVWVGDNVVEQSYMARELYPDDDNALFVWKPLISIK